MAEAKPYLDYTGLGVYDAKIKAIINTKEDAGVAQTKADAAELAAKNHADTKVQAVQTEVDALEELVGTVPAGSTTVIEYVNKKTENIASDEALGALTDRVDTIEDDYLKAADKTALEGQITAETSAREAADAALDARLVKTETFFETTEGETLDAALDTLVEIQTYIKSEGAAADQMVKDIAANTAAIEAEETRATGAEGALSDRLDVLEAIDHDAYKAADTALKNDLNTAISAKADQTTVDALDAAYKAADTALSGRITTLETAIGESGSIATDIANAKSEATEAAAADATTKANQALADAKAYTNTEVSKDRARLDSLESASHTHDNKTILDGIKSDQITLWNSVSTKAAAADLEAEISRAKAAEEANAAAIAAFTPISEAQISALFA